MSQYKFGNFEVEFDPTDVAFVEKYEAAAEKYNLEITEIKKDGKASEILRTMCQIFFDFFDHLFGEATHEKMFGSTFSVDLCVRAFKSLVDIMNDYHSTLNMLKPINRTTKRAKK